MSPKLFLHTILGLFMAAFLAAGSSPSALLNPDTTEKSWTISKVINGANSSSGPFQDAVAMDVDSEGNLFIVDRNRHRLIKFTSGGRFSKEIGGFGDGTEQFSEPTDVDAHLTLNIFVADYNNNRIVRFDSNLNYLNDLTARADGPYYFEMPLSVAVSGQYDIFLLEDLNRRVLKFNRFNQPQAAFGDVSENVGQLLGPRQITIDDEKKVFVSDPAQQAIMVFDYLGNYLYQVTHPDFRYPAGISISSHRKLVVADAGSQSIFFFNEGRRFDGRLSLKSYGFTPVDVFLWNPRGSKHATLLVLTPKKCVIFKQNR